MHSVGKVGFSGFTLLSILMVTALMTGGGLAVMAFSSANLNSLKRLQTVSTRDLVFNRIKNSLADPRSLNKTLADVTNADFIKCATGKDAASVLALNGCTNNRQYPLSLREGFSNEVLAGGAALSSVVYYTEDASPCRNPDNSLCTTPCPNCLVQASASFVPQCPNGQATCTRYARANIEFSVGPVSGLSSFLSKTMTSVVPVTPGALHSGGRCTPGRVFRGFREDGFLDCWTWQLAAGNQHLYVIDMKTDTLDNLYVLGKTYGRLTDPETGIRYSGDGAMFISKFSPTMRPVWTRQFGTTDHDEPESMALDSAGNIFVAGETMGSFTNPATGTAFSATGNQAFILKFDSAGQMIWAHQFGTGELNPNITIRGLGLDATGKVIVAGGIIMVPWPGKSFSGKWWNGTWYPSSRAFWVAQFSETGTGLSQVWLEQLNQGGAANIGELAVVSATGDIYLVGETRYNLIDPRFPQLSTSPPTLLTRTIVPGNYPGEAFIVKYNSSGVFQWGKQFGTDAYDAVYGLAVNRAGTEIYVSGETNGTFPGYSFTYGAFLAKFDSSGNQSWVKQYIDQERSYAGGWNLAMNPSETHLYMTGSTDGSFPGNQNEAGDRNQFVGKFDLAGNPIWVRQFGIDWEWFANGLLAIDSNGNSYTLSNAEAPPPSAGFLDETASAGTEAYITKLDPSGR